MTVPWGGKSHTHTQHTTMALLLCSFCYLSFYFRVLLVVVFYLYVLLEDEKEVVSLP